MRGVPASGKSFWLHQHGFDPFVISSDAIRLMRLGPTLSTTGEFTSDQRQQKETWELLYALVEARMKNGAFVIVDATHADARQLNRYHQLVEQYRYRAYGITMDVSNDVAFSRNALRCAMQRTPRHSIERMSQKIALTSWPGWIKSLTPDEALDFSWVPSDFSSWAAIHVIGDVQGCWQPLYEALPEVLPPDELFIFAGDLLDRGPDNDKVLSWALAHDQAHNILFVEGNHERWIRAWAYNEEFLSQEFKEETRPQLERAQISKIAARRWYDRLRQLVYFTYHGTRYLVTHGGISSIPSRTDNASVEGLYQIATAQLIHGVGDYEFDVDHAWSTLMPQNFVQIHGHRNSKGRPAVNGNSINLENRVEFGGTLRVAHITPTGVHADDIQNEMPVTGAIRFHMSKTPHAIVGHATTPLLAALRANRSTINEMSYNGNISSFLFSEQAFRKSLWNETNMLARGLFINTETGDIVARGYRKFFAIDEANVTRYADVRQWTYPMEVTFKENGSLGVLGYDAASDSVIVASKSSLSSTFAQRFFRQLKACFSNEETWQQLHDYLQQSHSTILCEVISPHEDPHIIKESEARAVMLDEIDNESGNSLTNSPAATLFPWPVKKHAATLRSPEEFDVWMAERAEPVEGYVICDADNRRVKLKTAYYTHWKRMRGAMVAWRHGKTTQTGDFFDWVSTLTGDQLALWSDIVTLRDAWAIARPAAAAALDMNLYERPRYEAGRVDEWITIDASLL